MVIDFEALRELVCDAVDYVSAKVTDYAFSAIDVIEEALEPINGN